MKHLKEKTKEELVSLLYDSLNRIKKLEEDVSSLRTIADNNESFSEAFDLIDDHDYYGFMGDLN